MDASLRLRSVQHDKQCHSKRKRGIQCGCFASLSMTKKENALRSQQEERCHAEHSFGHSEHFFSVIPNTSSLSFPNAVRNPVWMLRFAQHDKLGIVNDALHSA